MKTKEYTITLSNRLIDEMISFPKEPNTIYLKIRDFFGCTPIYNLHIIGEPEMVGTSYVYKTKFRSKTIRIFGIKIKTIKL